MITIDETQPAARSRWYSHLYIQVLAAILLGVLVGHFAPATGEALKPLGDAFIKLVKMIPVLLDPRADRRAGRCQRLTRWSGRSTAR